jgi:hypothetical protein
MATSGDNQRPPAGNFNGRLRGESHGRRQTISMRAANPKRHLRSFMSGPFSKTGVGRTSQPPVGTGHLHITDCSAGPQAGHLAE